MDRGIFITFEGIEGSGKTTQAKLIADRLQNNGFKTIYTYEPGDTEVGKFIRSILLDPTIHLKPICELLLYFADRVQHVEEKIKYYLMKGYVVICDRYTDSTVAYQGYGRKLPIQLILELDKILIGGLKPDLTILLDLPVTEGLRRNRKTTKKDRFEIEDIEFHERVRKGYLELSKFEPERIVVVDASKDPQEINEEIYRHILWVLKRLSHRKEQ